MMSSGTPQQHPTGPINPHEMKKEDFRRGVITFALVIVGISFAASLLVVLFCPDLEARTGGLFQKVFIMILGAAIGFALQLKSQR